MIMTDIAGIDSKALAFVRRNLMLDKTDAEASEYFTRLIESLLKAFFSRINFFMHTVVQLRRWSPKAIKENDERLSFVSQIYT